MFVEDDTRLGRVQLDRTARGLQVTSTEPESECGKELLFLDQLEVSAGGELDFTKFLKLSRH